MADDFEMALLKIAASQMILVNRFNKSKMSALTTLTNLIIYFIKRCGCTLKDLIEISTFHHYKNLGGTEIPDIDDVIEAIKHLKIRVPELEHFMKINSGYDFLYKTIPKNVHDPIYHPNIIRMSDMQKMMDKSLDMAMNSHGEKDNNQQENSISTTTIMPKHIKFTVTKPITPIESPSQVHDLYHTKSPFETLNVLSNYDLTLVPLGMTKK
ncbi:hypothetical protein MXB_4377 [Myxobolus squamalis]|nr:hypothetical protein MXB_4377 [Myxobolus squamalis]